ncbi:hypothetical protein QBC34DRAFT_440076 [Podospora aff. communis PSN243]|uniref:F-box domain-containing protein n=1 Tax=Podospora aff. communis PSN243 TaxID=3040156 RepID=A0AAV9GGL9_9PEZI|nr:hypothetical protein QBC34DRAFT_440076 [Podospora aff. communis PSN243]
MHSITTTTQAQKSSTAAPLPGLISLQSQTPEPSTLIAKLARRPTDRDLAQKWLYRTQNPTSQQLTIHLLPKPSSPLLLPNRSTPLTSPLDHLPPELFDLLLPHLDMQSCARLSAASSRCHVLVHTNRIYRENLRFAWSALLAMAATGFMAHHNIHQIHHIIKSHTCAECCAYGPYVFLPTGERCCWECLDSRSLPRFSWGKGLAACGMSEGEVRRRVDAVWQSRAAGRKGVGKNGEGADEGVMYVWNGVMLLKGAEGAETGEEDEGGYICRGCVFLRYLVRGFFRAEEVTEAEVAACTELYGVADLAMHALSRDAFLEHVVRCPGARRLERGSVMG